MVLPAAILNEYLKRMLPVVAKQQPPRVQEILQTPYLTFTDPNHEALTIAQLRECGLIDECGLIRTPFKTFRFCMTDHKGRTVIGVVARHEKTIGVVAMRRRDGALGPLCWAITFQPKRADSDTGYDVFYDGRIYDTRSLRDVTDFVAVTDKRKAERKAQNIELNLKMAVQQTKDLKQCVDILRGQIDLLEVAGELATNKEGVTLDRPGMTSNGATFMAIYNSIIILSYEYLAPHNFTAKVTPGAKGKSVEWIKAREHYTIIHRHHSANNKTVREAPDATGALATGTHEVASARAIQIQEGPARVCSGLVGWPQGVEGHGGSDLPNSGGDSPLRSCALAGVRRRRESCFTDRRRRSRRLRGVV